jgi:DNA polymerase
MELSNDYYATKAALEWQFEMGVDETIGEMPVNRFDEPVAKPKLKIGASSNIAPIDIIPNVLPVKEAAPDLAKIIASKCDDLDALRNAMGVFDLCALKQGARNMVFADGPQKARVMVIGEAPNRDEDKEGKPFVGVEGAVVDKMFAAIGLSRGATDHSDAVHLSMVMPWRPPQDRDPNSAEIAMMLPFVQRHVDIVNPDFVILMGNIACSAGLNKVGISRFRGQWTEAFGKPCMPMLHPRALIRDPLRKRDAWTDLLALKGRMKQ